VVCRKDVVFVFIVNRMMIQGEEKKTSRDGTYKGRVRTYRQKLWRNLHLS